MGNMKINVDDGEVGPEQLQTRLSDVVAQFKSAAADWAKERAALFEDRSLLLQEVDDLRAIKGLEKFEFVSALPPVDMPDEKAVPELIDTSGRARIAAEQAIASNDVERLKEELLHQVGVGIIWEVLLRLRIDIGSGYNCVRFRLCVESSTCC